MLIQISKYLDIISPFLLLIFALVNTNIKISRDYIFWFLVVQTFLNGLAMVLYELLGIENLFIYNVNCLVSFFILSIYFSSILIIKNIRKIVPVIMVLFYLIFIYNTITLGNYINEFNSNIYGLANFILVTYCLLYYLDNLKHPTKDITHSPDFWYVTGILTYYASTFFIFISLNYLTQTKNHESLKLIWLVHNLMFLIMCVYLYKGMLCKRSQEKYTL